MRIHAGRLVPDPRTVSVDGHRVSNPTEAQMVAAGYLPYEPPAAVPETIDAARARRAAEIEAECAVRLQERWPTPEQLAALAGVPLAPAADIASDVAAHLAARDAALAAVEAAPSIESIESITPEWPA